MNTKFNLLLMFFLALTAVFGIKAQTGSKNNAPPLPSQQVNEQLIGWGEPVYLYPFEQMIRQLESPDRKNWQKPHIIFSKMGDISGKTVFDLGGGTGYFAFPMVERGARVIIADPDRRFLAYALGKRDALGITEKQLEVRPIPYDDPQLKSKEADVFLCVNTYHMIENRIEYFRKVFAGMKKDGRIIIVNFKKKETPNGPPADRRLESDQVMKELESAGFEAEGIDKSSLPYNDIVTATRSTD